MAADCFVVPRRALATTDELLIRHRMLATVIQTSEPSRIQSVPTDNIDRQFDDRSISPGTPTTGHRVPEGGVFVIAVARRVARAPARDTDGG